MSRTEYMDLEDLFEFRDRIKNRNGEHKMNTFLVTGYHYVIKNERNPKRNFSEIVLAENMEEAISIVKSQNQYHDAAIDHVEMRDSNILVRKGGKK